VPARETITGAMNATMMSSRINPSATMAILSRRRRRQNSCIGERAVIFFSAAPPSSTTSDWSSDSCMSPTGSPVLKRAPSRCMLR
jgi:hypothetical protein